MKTALDHPTVDETPVVLSLISILYNIPSSSQKAGNIKPQARWTEVNDPIGFLAGSSDISMSWCNLPRILPHSRTSASYLSKPFTWVASGSVSSSLASKLLPFAVHHMPSNKPPSSCQAIAEGNSSWFNFYVIDNLVCDALFAFVILQRTAPCSLRIKDACHYVQPSWHSKGTTNKPGMSATSSGLKVLPRMNIWRSRKPANIVSSEKCSIQQTLNSQWCCEASTVIWSWLRCALVADRFNYIMFTSVIRNDPLMIDRCQSWSQGFCLVLNYDHDPSS